MAEAFAKAYRSITWTAAYDNPRKRTVATAKPLGEAVGLEMQLQDGLKEIRYGKWEDKTVDFVKQHYWDDYIRWLAEPAWNPPTGGETSVAISIRASIVIAEIQKKFATGNVLVVSHVIAIALICPPARLVLLSLTCMVPCYRYWETAPIWAKISGFGQELSHRLEIHAPNAREISRV